MKLSSSEVQEFFNTGYVIKKNLYSSSEVEEITQSFENLQQAAKQFSEPTIYKNSQFVVSGQRIDRIVWACGYEPRLKSFAQDSRLTIPSSQLLGSTKLSHIICQSHFKLPNDNVEFQWHQDSQNRHYGSPKWADVNGKGSFVQSLMAIDDSTLDSGPLYFIPGSCNEGHLSLDDDNNIRKWVDEEKAVPVLLAKGDTVFFNPYVIHGSKANRSKNPRRVFINGFAYPGANRKNYPGCGLGENIQVEDLNISAHGLERL